MVRCSSGGEASSSSVPVLSYVNADPVYDTFSAFDYEYYSVSVPEQDAGKNVSFQYNLDLGGDPKNVYFIFTNTNISGNSAYPTLDPASLNVSQNATPEMADALRSTALSTGDTAQRGKPEVSEFNRDPWGFLNRINPVNMLLNSIAIPEPRQDTENQTHTFRIDSRTDLDATCRLVRTVTTSFGNKTLNIWVADDMWDTYINSDKVTKLANRFLITGATYDNDIYDWVTNIYDEEWGSLAGSSISDTEKSMLISDTDQITILLMDIDADLSPNGGVVGYFWAKDNFDQSVVHYSNERIMFYIDAVMYANGDGTWEITDKWPSIVISTLSHEFQHMIHFYQKTIMKSGGTGSETWLDEMCAMATEDLVADKLNVDGPRGYGSNTGLYDYFDGDANNTKGRLPLYNLYNDYSVTNWYSGDKVLVSYSLNYALGAYLSRNYGGATFFRNVVRNEYTDQAAIEYALQQDGKTDTFGQVMQKWAIANLLSDKQDTSDDYRYNALIPPFQSTIVATTYKLGAINMYNYLYDTQSGPYIYTTLRPGLMPPASNIYYKAGDGLTGAHTWNLSLKSDVRMSVVVK
jgi:hypothetical protein